MSSRALLLVPSVLPIVGHAPPTPSPALRLRMSFLAVCGSVQDPDRLFSLGWAQFEPQAWRGVLGSSRARLAGTKIGACESISSRSHEDKDRKPSRSPLPLGNGPAAGARSGQFERRSNGPLPSNRSTLRRQRSQLPRQVLLDPRVHPSRIRRRIFAGGMTLVRTMSRSFERLIGTISCCDLYHTS
jgi:hypothetical protein